MFFEETLRKKLKTYYDLEDNFSIAGKSFDFLARYNQRSSKYVLKKNIELYAFENNEYIFYKKLEKPFTKEDLNEVKKLMNEHYDQVIDISENHMSSSMMFLFETALPVEHELINSIKKFKFYKSFKLGLNGWVNGGIMLINPEYNKGLSNKYAKKELKKLLA